MRRPRPHPLARPHVAMGRCPQRLAAGVLVIALACLAVGAASACPSGSEGIEREGLVKAAFLVHFLDFVTWPDSVATDVPPIGILGDAASGEALAAALTSRGEAEFRVRRTEDPEELLDCRIVYVALDDDTALRNALDVYRDRPILTVAHRERFAVEGGHVNFYVHEERLRFAVNLDAARRVGLQLSSRLLRLAQIVSTED